MGIIEGVASNAMWAGITVGARKLFGNQIRITHPRPLETLTEAQTVGNNVYTYSVRGTLNKLPNGHQIWVLTQDDSTGLIWPQGFSPVQYNPQDGTWRGRINGSGKPNVRIVAVVAPQTSQEFFKYFQKVGEMRGYIFEPIPHIPAECVNRDFVQATIRNP